MTRSPQEPTARAERAVEALAIDAVRDALKIHDAAMQLEREQGFPGMFEPGGFTAALESLGYTLVSAAAPAEIDVERLARAMDAEWMDWLNDEGAPEATDYPSRAQKIAAEYARLARSEGSDAEPAAMSLLDRDTYNRLAGSAEPDGGGGAL